MLTVPICSLLQLHCWILFKLKLNHFTWFDFCFEHDSYFIFYYLDFHLFEYLMPTLMYYLSSNLIAARCFCWGISNVNLSILYLLINCLLETPWIIFEHYLYLKKCFKYDRLIDLAHVFLSFCFHFGYIQLDLEHSFLNSIIISFALELFLLLHCYLCSVNQISFHF